MELLVGIDIGTTGCKAGVYTRRGEQVAAAHREYSLSFPAADWVEWDPEGWWEATRENLREILKAPGVSPRRIAAVGVSCTNALVPVDKNGSPVRPAIMQLDRRSVVEAEWLASTIGQERIFETCGNRIAAGAYSLPVMLWLSRHEPDAYRGTYRFLVPGGFIVHRLANVFSMDRSRANTTLLYDTQNEEWSSSLAAEAGVDPAKLPEVFSSDAVVGSVTREAARLTGLPPGVPVVAGSQDTVASLLGARVTRPGQALITFGTVGRISVIQQDRSRLDSRFMNSYYGIRPYWQSTGAVNAVGASVRWFRDALGAPEVQMESETGTPAYVALDRMAAAVPPGARGLIYLPYLAGERSPLWDANARGLFFGLGLTHRRPDMYRAILEGVAMALRQNLTILEQIGGPVTMLYAAGGGSRSKLWLGIVASALGRPLRAISAADTEVLGAARLAGLGTGLCSQGELSVAEEQTVEVLPNPAEKAVYARIYPLFTGLYESLKDRFAELAYLSRQGSQG